MCGLCSPVDEGLYEVGQFEQFEDWKRKVAALTAEVEHDVAVWDFGGYNSVTTEVIPSQDSEEQMQWYAESSHHTTALGGIMLSLMVENQRLENAPEDFGIQLNLANIEGHIEQIRADRELYHLEQPNEVAEVRCLASEVVVQEPKMHQQAQR